MPDCPFWRKIKILIFYTIIRHLEPRITNHTGFCQTRKLWLYCDENYHRYLATVTSKFCESMGSHYESSITHGYPKSANRAQTWIRMWIWFANPNSIGKPSLRNPRFTFNAIHGILLHIIRKCANLLMNLRIIRESHEFDNSNILQIKMRKFKILRIQIIIDLRGFIDENSC